MYSDLDDSADRNKRNGKTETRSCKWIRFNQNGDREDRDGREDRGGRVDREDRGQG